MKFYVTHPEFCSHYPPEKQWLRRVVIYWSLLIMLVEKLIRLVSSLIKKKPWKIKTDISRPANSSRETNSKKLVDSQKLTLVYNKQPGTNIIIHHTYLKLTQTATGTSLRLKVIKKFSFTSWMCIIFLIFRRISMNILYFEGSKESISKSPPLKSTMSISLWNKWVFVCEVF